METSALRQLNIEPGLFDQIIADNGARREIYECLMFCFFHVPRLKEIAAELLQYLVSNRADASRNDDDDVDWITVNGAHIPLDKEGVAVGGPFKGKAFGGKPNRAFSPKRDFITEGLGGLGPQEQQAAWEKRNRDTLKELIGEERHAAKQEGRGPANIREIVNREWYCSKTEAVSGNPQKLSDAEADEILYEAIGENNFRGWFRNADSAYKPRVVNAIISSDETRSAALSIMHTNYQEITGQKISFGDFLETPIKMFRGGKGQQHVKDDVFSAYSFSREVAEKFAGANGRVYEAEIRPIDTWGSVTTNKESEIMVPSWIAKNGNMDGGPGSGNHGHAGRPGEVGGAAPSDGAPASPESARAQGRAMFRITKRRFNDAVKSIAETDSAALGKVKDLLDELPPGSTLSRKAGSYNDEDEKWVKEKDGTWTHSYQGAREKLHFSSEDLSLEFGVEPDERPVATRVALSSEEHAAYLERYEKTNWRKNETVWQGEGSLTETMDLKLRKLDLDHCGEGFTLTGADGVTYVKTEDGWRNSETYEKADMRRLNSPAFEGDFFAVNFGLNGISEAECRRMREVYEGMPDDMRGKYEKVLRETTFEPAMNGVSHYSPGSGKVLFDSESDAEVIIHECSHKLDAGAVDKTVEVYGGNLRHITSASQNLDFFGNLSAKRADDFEAMAKVVGFETNGQGWFGGQYAEENNEKAVGTRCGKLASYLREVKAAHGANGLPEVCDAISALTLNSCGETLLSGGHDAEYWQRPYGVGQASTRSQEYWANYCTLKATGNETALSILESITPNMFKAAQDTFEEVFGNG